MPDDFATYFLELRLPFLELGLGGLDRVLHLRAGGIGEVRRRYPENGRNEILGRLGKLSPEPLQLDMGGGGLSIRAELGVGQLLQLLNRLIVLVEPLLAFQQQLSRRLACQFALQCRDED